MVSKTWFSLLAAAAIFTGACATNTPSGSSSEQTGTAAAPEVAPLACTPLLSTTPFLSCGAVDTTQLDLATSFQTQIIAQMQAALSSLTLTTNLTSSQVILSSQASQFSTLFGTQIIAPLTPAGLFNIQVPLLLGGISPQLNLVANIYGAIPWLTPFGTAAPLLSPIDTTLAASNVAINSAATSSAAFNSAAFNSATFSAATMPLTFVISPAVATAAFTCLGAMPLGCL
jgi:hypothetical protein